MDSDFVTLRFAVGEFTVTMPSLLWNETLPETGIITQGELDKVGERLFIRALQHHGFTVKKHVTVV